ncbi:MAG: hypothetical protein AB7N65_07770 [Vicinamibacterales bacterium]
MAVRPRDLARRLREVIAALDRRAPRIGHAAEAAIALEAAALRAQAVSHLERIREQSDPALELHAAGLAEKGPS